MTTVGSYQAETRLPELLGRVERGESIVITRRGTPVALLTHPPRPVTRDVARVVGDMLAYRDRQSAPRANSRSAK